MRKKFSKLDKEEILILGGAGFLLLLVAVLSTLLVSSTNAREHVLLQYEAEHALTDFLFRMQEDESNLEELFTDNDDVEGLGIYNHSGSLIVGIGEIPDQLGIEKYDLSDGKLAEYNRSTGTIEYLRRAKIALTASHIAKTPLQEPLLKFNLPMAELLYISFDGSDYRSRMIFGWALDVFLILLMVAAFILIFRIYTRNRQYREKLVQQESLVSMGEAARTLAHEIKNPLSSISLQAAVLRKTIPSEQVRDVEVIEQEVQRLNMLSNRVGDFLKNPVGEPEQIDLEQFLIEMTGRFSREIGFEKRGEGDARVLFDRERARSVFENLLNNAMESLPEDSRDDPQVTIEMIPGKDRVLVRVMDRGAGLPEGAEKQLFDPFYTTKTRGSGIGLAITRRFITAGGGTMHIHSREGGGTTAEVSLPRSQST